MTVRAERLEKALSLIGEDGLGWFLHGQFSNLQASGVMTADVELRDLTRSLSFLVWDLWNILTIVARLDWQRQSYTNGDIGDQTWMAFAGCDIDLFHVQLRSLFDHLCRTIRAVSNRSGSIPESFDRLQRRLKSKRTIRGRPGEDLARVVESWEWFPGLVEARDAIVHDGGFTLVFLDPGSILFNMMVGVHPQIFKADLMRNERVVDFELYAGLYLGYLLAYLEHAAQVILARLEGRSGWNTVPRAKLLHSGLGVAHGWIKTVLKKRRDTAAQETP